MKVELLANKADKHIIQAANTLMAINFISITKLKYTIFFLYNFIVIFEAAKCFQVNSDFGEGFIAPSSRKAIILFYTQVSGSFRNIFCEIKEYC